MFLLILKKGINRFMKVYIQTLIAPLLSNMLFLGVFGGMLKSREVGIEGVGYLSFLVPGLAAMGAIFSAFQNPAFSMISLKYQDTIQDLNSYPMSDFEKTLAFVLGGTIRGLLIGTLTYAATVFFVGLRISNPFLFFLFLAIISFVFSSFGLIAGLFVKNFDRLNFILMIILTPLTYFGGVFFEVSKLPGFIPKIIYINPIFSLINLVRFSYLGVYEGNLFIHSGIMILLFFLSFIFAYLTLKSGVGLKKLKWR